MQRPHIIRGSWYGLSQWETTLHCNVVSHWLSPFLGIPLILERFLMATHPHEQEPLPVRRDDVEGNSRTYLEWALRYFTTNWPGTFPYGPLSRYAKLRVAHVPEMPGSFSPPPLVSDPDMHHGTCVTHVPWCTPGSLTNGFLWIRWRGKRSRHSRRMHNPQFWVSGMRPIAHGPISPRVYELIIQTL